MEETSGRHRGRRQRKRGWARTTAVAVVGLVIIWVGWSQVSSGPRLKDSATVKVAKPKTSNRGAAKSPVSQRTYVVMGVDEDGGRQAVKGVLALIYDPARNKVGGLIIDPNTYVSIPGRGFQSIHDGAAEGAANLEAAVSDMLGVDTDGYVVLAGEVFTEMVEDKKAGDAFSRYADASLSISAAKSLSAKIGNIPESRRTFATLPVKTIVIGEQTYYEPNKADLKRLVESLWGEPLKPRKSPVRVIILNGNGTPGVARTAADRLLGKGYKILDVKNADKFTYAKTEILIYNAAAKRSAGSVAKALGTGVIVDKGTVQDVTDIVIVIGKDFH